MVPSLLRAGVVPVNTKVKKKPWCRERWKAGGEGGDRGWEVRWHCRLNGHESEQAPGDGEDRHAVILHCAMSQTQLGNWTTNQQQHHCLIEHITFRIYSNSYHGLWDSALSGPCLLFFLTSFCPVPPKFSLQWYYTNLSISRLTLTSGPLNWI